MNNQRDNSSLWFLLGGFLSVTLIAFYNHLLSRPATPPASPPQPIQLIRVPEQSAHEEPESVNWDVIGFASAATTLIGTSIFFLSGWIYESRWYGFYGLRATDLELTPFEIAIQGIPGMLVFLTALFISVIVFIGSKKVNDLTVSSEDLPITFFWAYFISASIVMVLGVSSAFSNPMASHDLDFLLVLFPSGLIMLAWLIITFRGLQRTSFSDVGMDPQAFRRAKPLKRLLLTSILASQSIEITTKKVFGNSWQFWVGVLLIPFFFTSIATSAVLAEFDAIRGIRTMDSRWNVPTIYLYSQETLPIFEEFEEPESATSTHKYGPLGLLASNSNNYYFIDWNYYQVNSSTLLDNSLTLQGDIYKYFRGSFVNSPSLYRIPINTDILITEVDSFSLLNQIKDQ